VVHGKKEDICAEVVRLTTPVLQDLGMDLVDVELRYEQRDLVLTLFIDKEGGVTLDHCVEVSQEVGTLFDVEDIISGPYRLEVSSPGLDRPLKKLSDFHRFAGRPVKMKTRLVCDPDGSGHKRKTFRGLLKGVDGNRILLQPEGQGQGEIGFLFEEIEKANLEFS
jgi:ribosome maturation factor RimP